MCCTSEESQKSCVCRFPSGLLWKSYMCVQLISAPEAFRCPLEAVPACVPARLIDFSGQALHPHIPVLASAMLCCSCLAASSWCFPRVYGSFTCEPKVNVHSSAAPAVSWHAESLCLSGLLYSFSCLVLDFWTFSLCLSQELAD